MNRYHWAVVVLIAVIAVLLFWSLPSHGATVHCRDARGRFIKCPPPPAPAPVPSAYDTSVGMGVDASGSANLPLRAGAHRYFVNASVGSDGRSCADAEQPSAPLRSIAVAANCIAAGNGDQMLVAEGTAYAETLPRLDYRQGYSPAYPTAIQSYDPVDPLNEGKYGRAANGRRPVITGGDMAITCCAGATPMNFLAIRGFDINPGNQPDMHVSFVGSNSYVLIENNLFRYTTLSFDRYIYPAPTNHIVRKNSFYGEWSPTAHAQGLYDGGTNASANGLTAEDNIFWHIGWRIGSSRDDITANGGPTVFRHSIYAQVSTNATVRRNLFVDSAATGCSCRGDIAILENVFIDNPIAIAAGLGDDYNVQRPNGVLITITGNAILGDADIDSSNPRGMAIWNGNGKLGSVARGNVIIRSRNPNGMNVGAFITQVNYDQPSYMTYDGNLVWRFSNSTFDVRGPYPAQNHPVYINNLWDAPSNGSNLNDAAATFPNPVTAADLFAALGCGDKTSCMAKIVETPELGWGKRAKDLIFAGYGR